MLGVGARLKRQPHFASQAVNPINTARHAFLQSEDHAIGQGVLIMAA